MYKSAQHLVEKLGALPEDVRRSLTSINAPKAVAAIGQKYQLHIDRIGELADETWLVMLGVTKTADFIGKLAERLNIDRNKAGQIAADINTELFLPIRESLKKIQEEPQKTAEPSAPQPEPAPALPPKQAIISGIENPELATLSGDSVKKSGRGLSAEQEEILSGIENPPETKSAERGGGEVKSGTRNTAPAPQEAEKTPKAPVTTETVIPIIKKELVPSTPTVPAVAHAEAGGPEGEGRLPMIPPEPHKKPAETLRMPPHIREVKIAPRPSGKDPYREATH